MTSHGLTNYHQQASNFSKLPDYSIHCGTDYLAIKDVPSIIKKILPLNKILDLGCGTGLATRYLKKHFPDALIIGADINKSMLEQAVAADPKGIYIHLNDVDNQIYYPFVPNMFDAVVCSFMLHENKTLNELKLLLNHIEIMLRPKGLFLAWDVYENLFHGKWLTIETISPNKIHMEDNEKYIVRILPSAAEVTGTYWSPKSIANILEQLGFKNISVTYPKIDGIDKTSIAWLDETKLAPYFVVEAIK